MAGIIENKLTRKNTAFGSLNSSKQYNKRLYGYGSKHLAATNLSKVGVISARRMFTYGLDWQCYYCINNIICGSMCIV